MHHVWIDAHDTDLGGNVTQRFLPAMVMRLESDANVPEIKVATCIVKLDDEGRYEVIRVREGDLIDAGEGWRRMGDRLVRERKDGSLAYISGTNLLKMSPESDLERDMRTSHMPLDPAIRLKHELASAEDVERH